MFNCLRRYPISIWPLVMLVIVLLLSTGGSFINHLLRFDQLAISQGEWWRLFSAHFVHLGWAHTLLNSGGLLLVAWMQPRGAAWRWWAFYIVSALCISVVMYIKGDVSTYVGASGVLHGLLVLAAFFSYWLEAWRRILIIILISAKLIWEQSLWYEDTGVGEMIGGYVVVDAHFIGGLAGLLVIILVLIKNRINKAT